MNKKQKTVIVIGLIALALITSYELFPAWAFVILTGMILFFSFKDTK